MYHYHNVDDGVCFGSSITFVPLPSTLVHHAALLYVPVLFILIIIWMIVYDLFRAVSFSCIIIHDSAKNHALSLIFRSSANYLTCALCYIFQ